MQLKDAQRELRTVYLGGFWGQLVSSLLWLCSATLGLWVGPRAAIIEIVFGGFLIYPLTLFLLRISGRPALLSPENTLHQLGMQVAFTLPITMLLLVPAAQLRLTLFFPALMILLGSHYLPFIFLYGMRIFAPLAAILIGSGVVIAMNFPASFTLGAWVGGTTLFLFAWVGRAVVKAELRLNAVDI